MDTKLFSLQPSKGRYISEFLGRLSRRRFAASESFFA